MLGERKRERKRVSIKKNNLKTEKESETKVREGKKKVTMGWTERECVRECMCVYVFV